MRLINLATNQQEAMFNCNFDEDIKLEPNSKIALKNAVFETTFQSFSSTGITGAISGAPVILDALGTQSYQFIKPGNYSSGDLQVLLDQITIALNKICNNQNDSENPPGTIRESQVYSAALAYFDQSNGGRVSFTFKMTPVIPFMGKCYTLTPWLITSEARFSNFLTTRAAPVPPLTSTQLPIGLKLPITDNARNDMAYRLTTPYGVGLSKGNGIFLVQIAKSVVDGVNGADYNGFGFGIGFHQLYNPDNKGNPRSEGPGGNLLHIPDEARNIEIEFREPGQPYRFRNSLFGVASAFETALDSGGNPILSRKVVGGVHNCADNDILMLEITTFENTKIINGHIIQNNGSHLIFTHMLEETEQLTRSGAYPAHEGLPNVNSSPQIDFVPYLYLRGNENNIELGEIYFTLDPFLIPDIYSGLGGAPIVGESETSFNSTILPIEDLIHYNRFDATILNQNIIPIPRLGRFQEDEGDQDPATQSQITITSTLSKVLGDDMVRRPNARSKEKISLYTTKAPVVPSTMEPTLGGGIGVPVNYGNISSTYTFTFKPLNVFSDFFFVEALNLNLDSYFCGPPLSLINTNTTNYESIEGGRKNILSTIPVEESDGLITYEPNNLHFINIKNTQAVDLRNLRLRIVNSDFLPLDIFGTAHVSILIKDENE